MKAYHYPHHCHQPTGPYSTVAPHKPYSTEDRFMLLKEGDPLDSAVDFWVKNQWIPLKDLGRDYGPTYRESLHIPARRPLKESKHRRDFSYESVSQVIGYNPETGKISLLKQRKGKSPSNPEDLGVQTERGYHYVNILGRRVFAHRLAWFLHYKTWPKHPIDHINGNPADNRIVNLREAPCGLNSQAHRRKRENSTSKYRGVCRPKSMNHLDKPWLVQARKGPTVVYGGHYANEDDAARAYDKIARTLGFPDEALNVTHFPHLADSPERVGPATKTADKTLEPTDSP